MFRILRPNFKSQAGKALLKPQASPLEHVRVRGRNVEISRRAYKRSLGMTLKMNGVIRVSAPKGIPTSKICDFVESQEAWIETNLKKYESVRSAFPKKEIREGEMFPYLGANYPLTFEPMSGAGRPCIKLQSGKLICQIRREMWHVFDRTAAHPELYPALCSFYKKKSREVLISSVNEFSKRMQLQPTGLSFRAQKTRWGSCSSRGRISLNWKLIIAPLEVLNYVVVHELAHLKFYDHSKSFWGLVATQVPDFSVRRHWLKENQFLADFLATRSELHPQSSDEQIRHP